MKPVLFLKQEQLLLVYLKLFPKQHKSGQMESKPEEGVGREVHSCNPFVWSCVVVLLQAVGFEKGGKKHLQTR